MFSIEERDGVADLIVDRARGDERIVALARTGTPRPRPSKPSEPTTEPYSFHFET